MAPARSLTAATPSPVQPEVSQGLEPVCGELPARALAITQKHTELHRMFLAVDHDPFYVGAADQLYRLM
ncbi:hypothetical protein ASD48_38280 [Streptomyces sp. Root1310]|nr:hypothetical protein ASD48_38280 [Streptomyces sp. Root1310]